MRASGAQTAKVWLIGPDPARGPQDGRDGADRAGVRPGGRPGGPGSCAPQQGDGQRGEEVLGRRAAALVRRAGQHVRPAPLGQRHGVPAPAAEPVELARAARDDEDDLGGADRPRGPARARCRWRWPRARTRPRARRRRAAARAAAAAPRLVSRSFSSSRSRGASPVVQAGEPGPPVVVVDGAAVVGVDEGAVDELGALVGVRDAGQDQLQRLLGQRHGPGPRLDRLDEGGDVAGEGLVGEDAARQVGHGAPRTPRPGWSRWCGAWPRGSPSPGRRAGGPR